MSWIAVAALGYLGLILLVAVLQRRLIYLPTRQTAAAAAERARQLGATQLTHPDGNVVGWRFPSKNAPTGHVMVLHGNAGCALGRDYFADPIRAAGDWEVVVVEYPGYGSRPGSPDLAGFLRAAEAALAGMPSNAPIYLVSESLGAGAAAHLARRFPNRIGGLVMFAPYDDLGAVAQAAFPFLPAKWLLRDRFRPADWLQDYGGPIAFVLAGADEVIPLSRGQSLAAGYRGPKRIEVIPHARHNDLAAQTPEWWRGTFEFLGRRGE